MFFRQGQGGKVGHQRVDGQQHAGAFRGRQRFQRIEGDGPVRFEAARGRAHKAQQMSAAAERAAQVFGQGAHIGAAGAAHLKTQYVAFQRKQLQLRDAHPARRARQGDAGAGVLVQRPAGDFEGGIHGRGLLDFAAQRCHGRFDLRGRDLRGARFQDIALGVAGSGGDPQAHHRAVALVRPQQKLRKLGRVPEAQRQQAFGKGIQRAGVAGLGGIEQAARTLQRGVRRQAGRLVEQEQAVHRLAGRFHGAARRGSAELVRRLRCPRRRHGGNDPPPRLRR